MVTWAIQRADDKWLALDYGWTTCENEAIHFEFPDDAEDEADRLLAVGVACRVVASGYPVQTTS